MVALSHRRRTSASFPVPALEPMARRVANQRVSSPAVTNQAPRDVTLNEPDVEVSSSAPTVTAIVPEQRQNPPSAWV